MVGIRGDNGPSPKPLPRSLVARLYAIRGDGIPGRTYRIQYADQMQPANWQPLGTNQADIFGFFGVIDSAGSPGRFYRSVNP